MGGTTSTHRCITSHVCLCPLPQALPWQQTPPPTSDPLWHQDTNPVELWGAWLWLTLSTCTAKVVPSHSSLHACPAGHGRLFGRGNAGRPTQSTQSPGASGSPNQWHKDVFLPASSISVTVQESKAGLGLAMQSAELRHGLVTSAIKEYSGGKLFTLMIWLVSSPQISVQELTILQRLPGKPGHSRLGSFNINNAESQPEKSQTLKLQQQGP